MKLEHYKFSDRVKNHLAVTVELIAKKRYRDAEKSFAKKTLELLDRVENNSIEPKEADQVFTLLDIYVATTYLVRIRNNSSLGKNLRTF